MTQELFAEIKTDISGNAASTSCLGNQQLVPGTNCRNCGTNLTPSHQCDGFTEPPSEAGFLNPEPRKYCEPPSRSGRIIRPKKFRDEDV